MQNHGFTEADWKLFRKRLPEWQEHYMEGLIEQYKEILSTDEPASSKFWELEKRLKKDKRDTGVLATDISRSNMRMHLIELFREGAITEEDLAEFSEELRETLPFSDSQILG